jgi:hypothetical protein
MKIDLLLQFGERIDKKSYENLTTILTAGTPDEFSVFL